MKFTISVLACFLMTACHPFDTSKIIEPTDYQIQSVSFNLSDDVFPTNMAAQKVEDHQNYTLVGAKLQQGNHDIIALWLFNTQDSSDIHSMNQIAEDVSDFPSFSTITAKREANNLIAFLEKD